MTDIAGAAPGAKGQLDREAADWVVRMHGENAAAVRPEFEAWLRRGALHRQAYNRMEEVYLLAARLDPARMDPAQFGASAHTDKDPGAAQATPRARLLPILGCAAAGVVAIGVWTTDRAANAPGAPGAPPVAATLPVQARIATEQGRPGRFVLADGSTVTLAGASAARIAFGSTERRIDLLAGRGLFRVAHAARPFNVWAGGGRVTALGTRFAVEFGPGRTILVRLYEGRVELASPAGRLGGGRAGSVVRMRAGQTQTFEAEAADMGGVPGAISGAIEQPGTVGALIDRTNARFGDDVRIELNDPSIRSIRLGGMFGIHDPDVVADRLAAMLGLRLDRSRPGRLVLTAPTR